MIVPSNVQTSTHIFAYFKQKTQNTHKIIKETQLPKEHNNIPVTDAPKMEIYELQRKNLKIIILSKLNDL